ncbi:MAG: Gfo/Idh/MocA family oxidoreductase [Rubellimicrobium sp.]|nr:Gfo/Idh/MocA family oxidoreductase [Rubellimicrobium sp.]
MAHLMTVGVIGCGQWGRNHATTLASLSALSSVADLDPARRDALAGDLGCQADTTDAILDDPAINAVVVALPPAEQASIALRAIAAGKHLLVEKPMALDTRQSARIAAAANASGLVAMTGHLLLFHPAWHATKAMVAAGELGRLRHIRMVRTGPGRFHAGTDVIWDLMPHDLALVHDLLGDLPPKATMSGTSVVSEKEADIGSLVSSFPGGPTLEVFVSRVSTTKERRLILTGSDANLIWDESEDWDRRVCIARNTIPDDRTAEIRYLEMARSQPLAEQLKHFLDAIAGTASARGTVSVGHDVLEFIQNNYPEKIT